MSVNLDAKLIVPCGINCGTCIAFFGYTMSGKKRKHSCSGCWSRERPCAFIKKKCKKLASRQIQYCFECNDFPCKNLVTLEKRYTKKYGLSLVGNLRFIQKNGIDEFLKYEKEITRHLKLSRNPPATQRYGSCMLRAGYNSLQKCVN